MCMRHSILKRKKRLYESEAQKQHPHEHEKCSMRRGESPTQTGQRQAGQTERQADREADRTDGWTHGPTVTCQTFFWQFVIASRSDTCQQSDFASHLGAKQAYPSSTCPPHPIPSSLSASLSHTSQLIYSTYVYDTHPQFTFTHESLCVFNFPNDICTLTHLAVALLIRLSIIIVIKQYICTYNMQSNLF